MHSRLCPVTSITITMITMMIIYVHLLAVFCQLLIISRACPALLDHVCDSGA